MTVNKRRLNTFLTYYAQLDINKISNKRTDQYIYLTFIYLRLFFFCIINICQVVQLFD